MSSSTASNVQPHAPHMHQIKEEEEDEKEGAAAAAGDRSQTRWRWGEEWKRAYLVTCAAGLIVDPLFLYTLSISSTMMCLFIDGWFALTVTLIKSMIDVLHVCNIWLKLSSSFLIFFSSSKFNNSSSSRYPPRCRPVHSNTTQSVAVDQDEELEEDAELLENKLHKKRGCIYFLKSNKGLILDLYVILPLIQVVLWVAAPHLIRKGSTTTVMTVFLVVFLLQYLPKIYHSVRFLRSMHNFSGYIFGTIWWGIALNLIAYFVASHAVGACWYLLGIQRASKCLKEQCTLLQSASSNYTNPPPPTTCTTTTTACLHPIYYGASMTITDPSRISWAQHQSARDTCLSTSDNFQYGAYKWTVQLVTNNNRLEKILLPIFWGLMTLSTFGNLESTTEWLEIVFNIIIITGGLILVTMLIGNIKVFLNATTSKKQSMHLRMRSMDWWMKKKKVPQSFRQRVRQYERQRWAAMRGVDEVEMVRNLPEGLRRDIKYHLCLDLVRQVPLFQHMDELVLENICDRVKSLIFPKGEVITREGDPVQRMIFVVRGHLQSSQQLRDGVKSYCMLGPGNFSGDELLSWCMRRPFIERLPPSSSSLITLETTEAFGLEARDVKYVTQHFRYTFVSEKVRMSARYYSPGWRTWAAVAIQLAWRRYTHRKTLSSLSFIRPRRPLSRCSSLGEEKLRLYTALLTSPKPHADDFFM